jgi:hypothetical protein
MINAQTYDELFPPSRKPPTVRNYDGKKVLDATKPTYQVELDAGAFRVLWEYLEHEARFRFPAHNSMASVRALLRAVEAFRETYWTANQPPRGRLSEAVKSPGPR